MRIDYRQLGKLVRQARRDARLNQSELAVKLGLSRNYVSMIERAEVNNLSVEVFCWLAEFIGVRPAELMGAIERGAGEN